MSEVTVAIPVRDGGELLAGVLRALATQTVAHELLICDSGSRDGSRELARAHGARVLEIAPHDFKHGGTRNLLVRAASGRYVALLTQDAEPVGEDWLASLLSGFELAGEVAVAYGPYRPRPTASPAVRLELDRWFDSLAPDGAPRVECLAPHERALPALELLGRRGFLTDANACLDRCVWERVPFRSVPYAEDRVLAIELLRAGYAKAFVPAAAVWHSHDYTSTQQLRRAFDEWRGLLEVYGWREPLDPRRLLGALRGELGAASAELTRSGAGYRTRLGTLLDVGAHQLLRLIGSVLGSRADRLPPRLRRSLSLEGRAGFQPLDLDGGDR
jgi:GT2 family glycosyltransferase